jgi:hypothetical protein
VPWSRALQLQVFPKEAHQICRNVGVSLVRSPCKAVAMAEAPVKEEVSPLSSEFEDLGVSDEASKSTGGGGEADWSEGGEEVVGRRHGSSGSATSPLALHAGAPAQQSMSSEAARAAAAQTQAQQYAASTGQGAKPRCAVINAGLPPSV